MKTFIYLDDERTSPVGVTHRVYTAREAVHLLTHMDSEILVNATLSLDHDLGDDTSGTGYTVACWLEHQANLNNWNRIPKIMLVHSANPAGAKNIQAAIFSIEKMRSAYLTSVKTPVE